MLRRIPFASPRIDFIDKLLTPLSASATTTTTDFLEKEEGGKGGGPTSLRQAEAKFHKRQEARAARNSAQTQTRLSFSGGKMEITAPRPVLEAQRKRRQAALAAEMEKLESQRYEKRILRENPPYLWDYLGRYFKEESNKRPDGAGFERFMRWNREWRSGNTDLQRDDPDFDEKVAQIEEAKREAKKQKK